MGYSRNPRTLEDRLEWLEPLLRGETCTWEVPRDMGAHNFAYKIREALYIGELYPNLYPKVANAKQRFTIQVISPEKVIAIKKGVNGEVMVVGGRETPALQAKSDRTEIEGPQTAMTIIEAWIDKRQAMLYFPEADLSAEDRVRLYEWAEKRDLMFFVASEGQLTIQKSDPELEEFKWKPA